MIKILHIADLHLGLRFRDHPEVMDLLSGARYETLESIVAMAGKEDADILSIAGDLFDRTHLNKSDIRKAVSTINKFAGKAVLVLPGNHDYMTEDSDLWNTFENEAEGHVIVLKRQEITDLEDFGLKVLVYPGPCPSKHSGENSIKWIRDVEKDKRLVHIGIAHGSVEGMTPDFEQRYYPMTEKELRNSGVDLWLLGHTHTTFPENPGERDFIFNPGTPEPDGFDCTHEGRAFIITVSKEKEISARIISTGAYRFVKRRETPRNEKDIDKLVRSITGKGNEKVVLQLIVDGYLDEEHYRKWKTSIPVLREGVLELKLDDSLLIQRVTAEKIRIEFPEGSFPNLLLSQFLNENDEQGLQLAYELIREVKDDS